MTSDSRPWTDGVEADYKRPQNDKEVTMCTNHRFIRMLTCAILGFSLLSGIHSTQTLSQAATSEGLWGKLKASTSKVTKPFGQSNAPGKPQQDLTPRFPQRDLTEANFAGVQFAMGRSCEAEGNLRSAESSYQAAIRNDSTNPAAYHRLALVQEKLGSGNSSKELLLKAHELDRENAEILCDLGYWFALRDQTDEAINYYSLALEKDPQLKRAHNNLGLLLASLGDDVSAMSQFAAAGLSVAEARCNLGFARMRQHHWGQAEAELQIALEAKPDLQQAKVLNEALHRLNKTTETNPPNDSPVIVDQDIPVSVPPVSTAPEAIQVVNCASDPRQNTDRTLNDALAGAPRVSELRRIPPPEQEVRRIAVEIAPQPSEDAEIPQGKADFLRVLR